MREAVVEQEVSRVHMPRIDVAKLAAVQQQSKDSSRSSMAATGQETFLPVPLPGVEAADAIDTVSATVQMPAPDAVAEASRNEPSAAEEEAVVEQQASGEADKPALAEAAVTGQETVLPAPLPAEVEADAVDTATVEMPEPETTAEASCSEPSAAKETPANGLASL
ncbi:unnamed protein product, partial [Symbiodinium sp. CCMP2456]